MARVQQSFEAHTKSIDASGALLSATIPFIVFDAIDEDDALQAVLETAETDLRGIPLSNVEISERCNDAVYKVDANYEKSSSGGGSSGNDADDAVEISFSTGGGTKHVVQPINQIVVWDINAGKPGAVDKNTPIGWNGKKGEDADYAGVDVPDANIQLTITVKRKMSDLDTSWQANISTITGKVNSKNFRGWHAGQVLFEGVSFSGKENDDNVSVSYNFSIRSNEKNVKIAQKPDGTAITTTKRGFEYAWTITKRNPKTNRDEVQAVFLAEVLKYADFSVLGV